MAGHCLFGVRWPGKWPHPSCPILSHPVPSHPAWPPSGAAGGRGVSREQSCGLPTPCVLLFRGYCSQLWCFFPQRDTSLHSLYLPPNQMLFTRAPGPPMGIPMAVASAFAANTISGQAPVKEHSMHLCVSGGPLVLGDLHPLTKQTSIYLFPSMPTPPCPSWSLRDAKAVFLCMVRMRQQP